MTRPQRPSGGVGGRAASPARNSADQRPPGHGEAASPAETADQGPSWVLHFDLDQFIAAVEVRRHPELAGKPVVIGGRGDPTERAVVATASYEAREFGVRSGMPMRIAARKCPDAIFLPHDREVYEQASAEVVTVLQEFDAPRVIVELIGWDESFLGLSSTDPEAAARRIQSAVVEATGLHSSIGIGDTTIRAKTATGFAKPAGVFRLVAENWPAVMGARPTTALWGIGTKTARKLQAFGLETVDQLANADAVQLAAAFGRTMGPWYIGLARGQGRSDVIGEPYVPRSHSRETTYQQNLQDWQRIRDETALLATRVAGDVIADGRPAVRVAVKVRFAPFFTQTLSVTLPAPTDDAGAITAAALEVLERFEHDRPVRLLGVRAEFDRQK